MMWLVAAVTVLLLTGLFLRWLLSVPYRGVGADYYKKKRRFVVTGSASGMGRHLVGTLLHAGHAVIATDVQDLDAIMLRDEWTSAAERYGGEIRCERLDVTSRTAWEAVFATAEKDWGGIDVVMNVAGYLMPKKIQDATAKDIDTHIDVMMKGPIHGTQLGAALMVKHGIGGHIINVSSMAAIAPVSGVTLYAAAKFGCRGFSLAASKDLAPLGIAVTCLMPDACQTPMVDLQLNYDGGAYAFSGEILSVQDIGRCVMEQILPNRPPEVWLSPRQGVVGFWGIGGMFAGVIHSSRLVSWVEAKMQRDGMARQETIRTAQTTKDGANGLMSSKPKLR
jgi:3-oxoacyl-[acyl-carrier protein] reductase